MKTFQVNDMVCGHCVDAVTKAVKGVDPAAYVAISLTTKQVGIDSAIADASSIKKALAEAGYPAVEESGNSEPVRADRTGGCCGCSSRH